MPRPYQLAEALEQFHRAPVRRAFLAAGIGAVGAVGAGVAVWYRQHTQAQRKLQIDQVIVAIRDAARQRSPGWSWTNRDLLLQLKDLDCSGVHTSFLRSEWSRCLVTPDLRLVARHTPGKRYTRAEFPPCSTGHILAMAVHLRGGGFNVINPLLVRLYDTQIQKVLHTWKLKPDLAWELRKKREDDVRGLAFTPDGQWLFISTRSGGIYVVKPAQRDDAKLLAQDTHTVCELFPTPDSKAVLTVSLDGTVHRYDLNESDWKETAKTVFPSPGKPFSEPRAAINPQTGDLIVVANRVEPGRSSSIFQYSTYLELLREMTIPGTTMRFQFAPHGDAILYTGWDQIVWQELAELKQEKPLALHSVVPLDKSFDQQAWLSPQQQFIVQDATYANSDHQLRVYDLLTQTRLLKVDGHDCNRDACFAPDAPLLALTMGADCFVYETSKPGCLDTLARHADILQSIGLSADGQFLWTTCNGEMHRWNCDTGAWLGQRVDILQGLDTNRFATLRPRGLQDVWVSSRDRVFEVGWTRWPSKCSACGRRRPM